MTNNITEPLRLAVGSHKAGSGKGCAMNVVSWINGDTIITDTPGCADPMLTRIVQRVNDAYCTHRQGDLLCPTCSIDVLNLGYRTIGTAGLLPELEMSVVRVRVACRLAREVAYLNTDPKVMAAIEAAEAWTRKPTAAAANAAYAAANAANAAANAAYAAANAANAANAAANAAAYAAHAAYAAYAAAYAAHAAYAAYAAYAAANAAADERMRFAHMTIDIFNELTGRVERQPDHEAARIAIDRMIEVSA